VKATNNVEISGSCPSQPCSWFKLSKVSSVLAILVVLAFTNIAYSDEQACNIDASTIDHAIVQIEQDGNFSTAVVIDENRLLTVAHAIDMEDSPKVITANVRGRYVAASPMLAYLDVDLAVLEADTGNITPLPLAKASLQMNENIWVTGFPLGRARTIETGTVSDIRDDSVITSATVFPGVSGGALIRCNSEQGLHELAGIVTSYVASVNGETVINTGRSVSLRIDYIESLLSSVFQQFDAQNQLSLNTVEEN